MGNFKGQQRVDYLADQIRHWHKEAIALRFKGQPDEDTEYRYIAARILDRGYLKKLRVKPSKSGKQL